MEHVHETFIDDIADKPFTLTLLVKPLSVLLSSLFDDSRLLPNHLRNIRATRLATSVSDFGSLVNPGIDN